MPRQDDLNAIYTSDLTDVKAKLQTLNDVLNVMDWAIDSTLDQLEDAGTLEKEVGLLTEYRKAIKVLRKQGFKPPKAAETIQCPSCKANLSIAGEPGESCSWCGYQFK